MAVVVGKRWAQTGRAKSRQKFKPKRSSLARLAYPLGRAARLGPGGRGQFLVEFCPHRIRLGEKRIQTCIIEAVNLNSNPVWLG